MFRFIQKQLRRVYRMSSSISIATQAQTLKFFESAYGPQARNRRIYGFYSSDFNKIIVNQHHMLIPIDERIATRAHGAFDVIYMKKLNLINLDSHLLRLIKSSQSVSIEPPMKFQQMKETVLQIMKRIVEKMMKQGASQEQLLKTVFGIRLTISSGYGDFGIASLGKKPVLYASVFQPYINYDVEKEGVNEFVVDYVDNSAANQLVHSKTVNYISNALMANKSKELGGYQGIKAQKNGVLLEAAVANIAFIFGRQFATPRFETVIQGTTIKKLLKYIEELKQEGKIDKISFRDITIEQAENTATEMMVIGGDKIVPVLKFNNKQISEKKGKFAEMFQQWYQKQNEEATPLYG